MVVLGDFNAYLSDSRSGGLENRRGKLLRVMFNKFNMTSINTQDYCSGSKYSIVTYVSATGNTIVDYPVFVEHTMQKFVTKSADIAMSGQSRKYSIPSCSCCIVKLSSSD